MHSAPAVTYPVGRSSFQVWLLCLTGLASVLVGLLWQYQGGPIGWRHGLYALTAVVCGFFAFRAWRLTPTVTCAGMVKLGAVRPGSLA